jgi:hypothetical protein
VPNRWAEVVIACGLAACLPPETPAKAPAPVDPDAELAHAWKITGHVLAAKTSQSDRDAGELHGRVVDLRNGSYVTPWHGTCEDVGRQKRARVLADVALELDLSAASRGAIARYGVANELVEYQLSCNGKTRTPALLIFVGGARALTCFAGVCYLLER